MNREKQLVKNTAIITIGKICTQVISFFLLPLYTAILTTEEYGIVDLLNTLISLLLPIVTLQLEQASFRKLVDCRENEVEIKQTVSNTFFITFVQSVIYLLVYLGISPLINNQYKLFLSNKFNWLVCIQTFFLQIARG